MTTVRDAMSQEGREPPTEKDRADRHMKTTTGQEHAGSKTISGIFGQPRDQDPLEPQAGIMDPTLIIFLEEGKARKATQMGTESSRPAAAEGQTSLWQITTTRPALRQRPMPRHLRPRRRERC
jgi:hypothetical protein